MAPEGEIAVKIRWDGARITEGSVQSTRPREPARLLVGLSVDGALDLLPKLFAICARAQSVAAELATERARGRVPDQAQRTLRNWRVAAESVHEHLWRVLLDWPAALGEEPRLAAFAAVRGALLAPELDWPAARLRARELMASEVLGGDPDDWRRRAADGGFDDWLDSGATPAARLLSRLRGEGALYPVRRVGVLPPMPAEGFAIEIARRLDADASFAAAPTWDGSPSETGALARHGDHPLLRGLAATGDPPVLPRLVARLLALEALTATDDPASSMGAVRLVPRSGGPGACGDALSWVDTARGLLMHRVSVVGDVVRRYRIVAPTEWNFHPRGALASELPGLRADDEATLRQRVALLVQSLDPCIGFRIEVDDA